MEALIQLTNVTYHLAGRTLLSEVNVTIYDGDVIGIVGPNGAGKSTLLQLLHGKIEPEEGQVKQRQSLATHHFIQEMKAYQPDNESGERHRLLSEWKVPKALYEHLSGGEQLKYRLADAFSQLVDVLLLDEPTNHLDETGMHQLIDSIHQTTGAVVIVSHDRYVLDQVATKIWSLESGTIHAYPGNYSDFVEQRKQKQVTEERQMKKQQKQVEDVRRQMKALTSWSDKAHRQSTKQEGYKEHYRKKAKRMDQMVKSKQKRLQRSLEASPIVPVEKEPAVFFQLSTHQSVGRRYIEVKDLSVRIKGRLLFQDVHVTIQHGERIALIGPNGCGKTTLIEVLMGKKVATGDVWVSRSAKVGYLTQTVFDLPLDATPEEMFAPQTFDARARVQQALAQLGFSREQWREPIEDMSMGERVKLKLMAFIIEGKDVLILDEPTNHLDLASREQLEKTLLNYKGTLIIVSHDRYFIRKVTDTQLVFHDQQIDKKRSYVQSEQRDTDLLTLETRRQEVLAKLSMLEEKGVEYDVLDETFNNLTEVIKRLKDS